MKERKFTTGEAAKITGLSQSKIISCFDEKKLGGFRTPGSKYRHIPRDALKCFMEEYEIPMDNFPGLTTENAPIGHILMVDKNTAKAERLQQILSEKYYRVLHAHSPFDAGLNVSGSIAAVVIDDTVGEDAQQKMADFLHSSTENKPVVIGLFSPDNTSDAHRKFFTDIYTKPVDMGLIAKRLGTLISSNEK